MSGNGSWADGMMGIPEAKQSICRLLPKLVVCEKVFFWSLAF